MDRAALLADLIALRRPLHEVLRDLEDTRISPKDLVTLTRGRLSEVLGRVRSGALTFADMIAWAKEVELTDDIGREEGWEEVVDTTLFEMASPELDDRTGKRRMKEWRGQLLGLNVRAVQTGARAVPKHESIAGLASALSLRERGWTETDNWDGDLFAVGIARADDPRHMVYVSTWKKARGRYYYECETPTGPDATDYVVTQGGEDVDFDALRRAIGGTCRRRGCEPPGSAVANTSSPQPTGRFPGE